MLTAFFVTKMHLLNKGEVTVTKFRRGGFKNESGSEVILRRVYLLVSIETFYHGSRSMPIDKQIIATPISTG
jgi:hypothetical protein